MPDSEREIYDQASAETPAVEPASEPAPAQPEPEPAASTAGQDRDEQGRFKPKAGTPEAAPVTAAEATPAQPQADHRIPLAEHLREREERQAAQRERDEARRQMEALNRRVEELSRPKAQPRPDIWQDPDGYTNAAIRDQVSPIQQQQDAMIDRFSKLMAVQTFGKPMVDEAYAALEAEVRSNPAARYEAQRIWQNEHPYGALIDWHKGRKALAEIGSDPAAYRKKLQDDLMKDPEHRKAVMAAIEAEARSTTANPGQARPTNVTRLPPSLNRVASAAPVNTGGGDEAISDADLYRFATTKG